MNFLQKILIPSLIFFFALAFVNSPFLFFDLIQHDDCNFLDGGYRNYILAHQTRLERPLSGFLQAIIFKIWRFKDFDDFLPFRILSMTGLSICALLIFLNLNRKNQKNEFSNYLAALSIVCLPGFSYIVLLNLLATETLGFILALCGGFLLKKGMLNYNHKNILSAIFFVAMASSIHPISSLFCLIPLLVEIYTNQSTQARLKCIYSGFFLVILANGLNIGFNKLLIKPILAHEFGNSIYEPLIATHTGNFSISNTINKLADWPFEFIPFASRGGWYNLPIASGITLSIVGIGCLVFILHNIKNINQILLPLCGSSVFLLLAYSPFLFSNNSFYFTRSIIPASAIFILMISSLLFESMQRYFKNILLLLFFGSGILYTTKSNFMAAGGLVAEYQLVKQYIKLQEVKFSGQQYQIIFLKPQYNLGNVFGNPIFADEWNFLNSLVEGNFNALVKLSLRELKIPTAPQLSFLDPEKTKLPKIEHENHSFLFLQSTEENLRIISETQKLQNKPSL